MKKQLLFGLSTICTLGMGLVTVSANNTQQPMPINQQVTTFKNATSSMDKIVSQYQQNHKKKPYKKAINKSISQLKQIQKQDSNGNIMDKKIAGYVGNFVKQLKPLEKQNPQAAAKNWNNVKQSINQVLNQI